MTSTKPTAPVICRGYPSLSERLLVLSSPKVAGSNPAPATMNDEGLADARAANPFRLPRPHPGIGSAALSGVVPPAVEIG
jgi:hypothetical protein